MTLTSGMDPVLSRTIISDWDFRRSIMDVLLLCDFAAEHGMTTTECLAGSGIDETTLSDPYGLIEASQEIAVVRNLQRHLGDRPGLGVEVGARVRLTTFGLFGYVLFSSHTMRDVFECGVRFAALSTAFSRQTGETDEQGRLVHRMRGDRLPADVRRFFVERDCTASVVLQRQMFAGAEPVPLLHVDIAFPEEPGSRHSAVFGVPITYDAESTALYYEGGFDIRVLPHGNPHTTRICADLCERLLADRTTGNGTVSAVRKHLLETDGNESIEHVARQMHITSRTLRRRLAAEGTSYRRLLDEVRLTIAREAMRDPELSAAELAYRLGYSEPSSFQRAFRRWVSTGSR
ncbi:AraC family transcriptional regulator [Streptomyces sp. NPDC051985]|uniref:AraC family transcriptional regulator n=1 Tax=Streptomyces sp. NPDC051985 TaxID=3155807 RepID=UPI00343EDAAB